MVVFIHKSRSNLNKVDWKGLSSNPSAIHLIEQHLDKVDWDQLSQNRALFEINGYLLK